MTGYPYRKELPPLENIEEDVPIYKVVVRYQGGKGWRLQHNPTGAILPKVYETEREALIAKSIKERGHA